MPARCVVLSRDLCCSLVVIIRGFILHLIGRETINIPELLHGGETELVKSTFLYLPLHQHFSLEFFLDRFFLKTLTTVDILFQKNNK